MRQMRLCILTLALVLALAGTNPVVARTIYYDSFDGELGTDLNGTTPDITTDEAVWEAGASIDADGTLGSLFTAILPFTPETGTVYVISATFDNQGDWAGIGFLSDPGNVANRINDNSPLLWSLTRPSGASSFDQAFLGPGTAGALGDSTVSDATELRIRIDTNSETEWVVTWFYDDVQSFQETVDPADYDINYVAFGGNGMFTPLTGTISSFRLTEGVESPYMAAAPEPEDEATDVRRDVVLGWYAGELAVTHDVYFGTVEDDVNNASRGNPLGVLVSQDQDANTYDPPSLLTLGQTYYWRIDEVNAPEAFGIYKGEVWSFVAEPVALPIEGVTATTSIPNGEGRGPENLVNGSGLNPDGAHGTDPLTMWQGDAQQGDPVWLQFEFGRVCKLQEMWVWNFNMQYEAIIGYGLQNVTIEYSTDGADWIVLGEYVFQPGTELDTYQHNTTVDFGGVMAKYVKLNVQSNFSGRASYGLSEVRFLHTPVVAREPEPAAGATDVGPDVTLEWRAGREAASHDIYFDVDEQAVADGTALLDTVAVNTYELDTLDLGTTYYWKVTEVNEAETPSAWDSDVWDFTTPDYLVVDDAESYTDVEGSRVYNIWLDGYDDNANGSVIGHDDPPYAEQTIVHGGKQSIPFYYGVEGAPLSTAELTFDAPQDWTRAGAQTLVLFFRGMLGNAAGQLFVEIDGTRVDYDGDAAALAAPLWKQWNIDMASLGAQSVTTLTVGVSASGTGLLYLDDIRLYRSAPPVAEPAVDPGTQDLAASYAMENNVNDGSGHERHGTAEVGASFDSGPTGYGQALVLDGVSGYAELPIGSLIESLSNATLAMWVNDFGAGDAWQRIFDFGSDTDTYMFLTPRHSGGALRCAITTTGGAGESAVTAPAELPTGWHHVAVAIDGAAGQLSLYLDGAVVASGPTATVPMDLGNTTQNWIGRSQYSADPYFGGSVDDFRIYSRALSAAEVRYLVGDR